MNVYKTHRDKNNPTKREYRCCNTYFGFELPEEKILEYEKKIKDQKEEINRLKNAMSNIEKKKDKEIEEIKATIREYKNIQETLFSHI